MQKILTRRAREYFEILDELRQENFITHEEWQVLPPNDQLSKSKMTNRIIEDALIDHGFSKGSPNELKKYRQLWMQERDIFPSVEQADSKIDIQSDPILSAVDHFRKKIFSEAEEKAQVEIQKLKAELEIVKKQYFEKSDIFQEVNEKYEQLLKLSEDLQGQCQNIDQQWKFESKKREIAEKRFEDADKNYNQLLSVNHQMVENLSEHDDQLSQQFDHNLEKINEQYKSQLNDLSNNFDRQAQDFLYLTEKLHADCAVMKSLVDQQSVEIQQYKDCSNKLQNLTVEREHAIKTQENDIKMLENANKTLEKEIFFVKVEHVHLKALAQEYKNQRDTANALSTEFAEKFGRLGEKVQQTENGVSSPVRESNLSTKESSTK